VHRFVQESLASKPPAAPAAPRPEAVAARARALSRQAAVAARAAAAAAAPPLLLALHASLAAGRGPLSLLADALARQARIRVVTRHATGVRGTLHAFLRAFDRFCNLILYDVDETYTVRLRSTREDPRDGPGARGRTVHKVEPRTRHLKQVFLRGENVVIIALAPAAAAAADAQQAAAAQTAAAQRPA
jgi:small nuclear ribonucleoprotein (snRNP)-like protein